MRTLILLGLTLCASCTPAPTETNAVTDDYGDVINEMVAKKQARERADAALNETMREPPKAAPQSDLERRVTDLERKRLDAESRRKAGLP